MLRFQCGVLLDVLQYFQSGTIDTYPIREMVDRRCGRFGYLDVLRLPKDKIGKMTEGSWSLHSYEFGDVEIACPAPNVAIIAYTGRQNVTMTVSRRSLTKAVRHETIQQERFPTSNVRRFLEPGPIVLVSSAWKGKANIMTMGWHMIMAFEPSLVGCYIWTENHSFEAVRNSKECVINLPTVDIGSKVVGIGNSSGRDIDKFVSSGSRPFRVITLRRRSSASVSRTSNASWWIPVLSENTAYLFWKW